MAPNTSSGHSRLLAELRADTAAIAELVATRIEHDDTDYDDAALGHPELVTLVADSFTALLDAMADAPYSLEPARRAGRVKAERGIPLESLLHAFRLAGMAFWEIVDQRADGDERAELTRLATRMWRVVDEYSVAAAEAYRRVVVTGTERSGRALLRALLDPGFPAARRAEAGRKLGLPTPAIFVVLVGDIRLAATGVTTVHTLLAEDTVTLAGAASFAILDTALDVPVRAGASRPFADLVAVPAALDQARLAFRCAIPADTGIHRYGSAPERALIAANPALAADVCAEELAALDRLPASEADLLVHTAMAWYELGGSTSAVGQRLHLHRNTVLQRLKRIERLTGSELAVPAEAARLHLALQTWVLRRTCGHS
ncbi:helix-turn-helix domain-containing protein [Nocardia sp. NPDC024068]|uniref:PucR family transcriptional regulator n=1 Tax=Nocardia sp. NPDC024068 TaxID=3157197 RepID=UPI0033C5314E